MYLLINYVFHIAKNSILNFSRFFLILVANKLYFSTLLLDIHIRSFKLLEIISS